MRYEFQPMILDLFEGEGAAPAAAAPAQGEANGAPASTRQAKGEYANVLFGKQPDAQPAEAEKNSTVQTTSGALDEKKAQWRQMVEGDFKELFGQDVQRIIDRRFKETKNLQTQVESYQPVIDLLTQRYGESDMAKLAEKINNDTAYWQEAAEEAGMSVDQYKEMQRLQRENKALQEAQRRAASENAAQQQLQKWYAEAEALKEKFPGFDLEAEAGDQRFVSMLKSGVPMEHAYKVLHMDDMMMDAMSVTAARTEQRVTENIRARGARPAEAGITAQGAYTVKDDVSKLTKKDRAEIAKRASRGEKITF